ncbi:hypothetical protein BW716_28190 [[Flexibacter] sp. ATCC 35208]|nr:hypothetical protein BW716_28190 [[Flexibacter] sp. ATCC 35208]
MNRELKWPHLKGLYELYITGQTSDSILKNAFVRSLKNRKLIGPKPGRLNTLMDKPGYKAYYEAKFLPAYQRYVTFLEANNIPLDGRQRFDEYDLETFAFIVERKDEILESVPSIRQFSSRVFHEKGSKYLEDHPGIASTVLRLLGLDSFPGSDPKENQWRFVIDPPSPKLIVLCENIANLKRPWIAIAHEIELWYVGGSNTAILENISFDKLQLPLFYCCDWDQDGIDIYKRIYKIFAEKGKDIGILTPYDQQAAIPEVSEKHESRWKEVDMVKQWPAHPFNAEQVELLSKLFRNKQWIEEESQDLVELLRYNELIKA